MKLKKWIKRILLAVLGVILAAGIVLAIMIFPTITVFLVTGVGDFFTANACAYTFYAENAPYNVYTLGYYLFIKVIGANASLADYPYAAAAGLCLTLVAAPITLLVKYLLEKYGPDPEY